MLISYYSQIKFPLFPSRSKFKFFLENFQHFNVSLYLISTNIWKLRTSALFKKKKKNCFFLYFTIAIYRSIINHTYLSEKSFSSESLARRVQPTYSNALSIHTPTISQTFEHSTGSNATSFIRESSTQPTRTFRVVEQLRTTIAVNNQDLLFCRSPFTVNCAE